MTTEKNLADLINDARNHLNFRTRGMAARLERLAAAGVPTDREAMKQWLEQTLDAQLEVAGGVYHACTVRISSGCDLELPTLGKIGCRISRVPLTATLETNDEGDSWYVVRWGEVGVGSMGPSVDHAAESAEEAMATARRRLLVSGHCHETRAAARVAVEAELHARAAR